MLKINLKIKKLVVFLRDYVFALFSCAYLFAVGFIFARNRFLILQICAHFGYGSRRALIPSIEISQIVPGDTPIQLTGTAARLGNIAFSEMACIAALIRHGDASAIFEIGTFDGRTTREMAACSRPDAKIFTLDLPREKISKTALPLAEGEEVYVDKNGSGEKFLGTAWEKKITQLYGDSATFDFIPYYDAMDFVFVDGSHAYEYVLHDVALAKKLLKKGSGTIVCHDYISWAGVTKALNELYRSSEEFSGLRHIKGTSLVVLRAGLK